MNENLYPVSPPINNQNLFKLSSSYKKNVILVLLSIFIFLLFYLILLTVSFALLISCLYAGFAIMSVKPSLITLAIGLGIFALGIMFFIFSIKFIFTIKKIENPYFKEITEVEQPILFSFLRKLSEESNVRFPKKVFVSPDVNASVFFNSSFLSLIFPVAKNLEIGLGLINTLNISEFKSVIAHEFGHFSQKSLMASSYIYTVNQAIYNMVFEYDSWDEIISKWASVGGILGLFAMITMWMVERVRNLLAIAYRIINVNYLKLSRDMEFNADNISARLTGSQVAVNALRKIDFAAESYQQMLDYLNVFIEQGKRSKNIYKNHTFISGNLANNYKIQTENGFPLINDDVIEKYLVKSRLIVKNQWASHPSLAERENNILKLNLSSDINSKPAWDLFSDAEQIQNETSTRLYHIGFPERKFSILEEREFEDYILSEERRFLISHKYNGFYFGGYIYEIDIDELCNRDFTNTNFKFDQIYSESNGAAVKGFLQLKMAMELINQIINDQVKIKFFEFDGIKYKRKEAEQIKKKLDKEYEVLEKYIIELSEKSFLFNFNLSKQFDAIEDYQKKYKIVLTRKKLIVNLRQYEADFNRITNDLYSKRRWSEKELIELAKRVSFFEAKFKSFIQSNDIKHHISSIVNTKQKSAISGFTNLKTRLINPLHFEEDKFIQLSEIVFTIRTSLNKSFSESLKDLTEYQLKMNGFLS